MDKEIKQYPNPEFSSLEEEEEYWKTHSPLDEGYEGEVQTSPQKRASFLSIRLTGDELSELRDVASKLGMGASTFARLAIRNAVCGKNLGLQNSFESLPYDYREMHDSFLKQQGIYIMDPGAISMDEDSIRYVLSAILDILKCRKITPEDEHYPEIERFIRLKR